MDLEKTLKQMVEGDRCSRTSWAEPDKYVEIHAPDTESKVTAPSAFLITPENQKYLVVWEPVPDDFTAQDWNIHN